jgi:ubiquinone/menaquinone biosynthesis C-methylase UbiE
MDIPAHIKLPGESLRWRVAATPDANWFWESGGVTKGDVNNVLSIFGKSIGDYQRVLDFGCGCGRVILHLEEVGRKVELHGTDIDAEAIKWAGEHIPWAKFHVNGGLPPLDFPDDYFDLIYNQSVFTHLDEEYQDAWLAELSRVTKPGGTLVLSANCDKGFHDFEKIFHEAGVDTAPYRTVLDKKGILFIANDSWKDGPFPDFYHSTFHRPWYIFEHWNKFLEIKAYFVRGSNDFQDFVLFNNREKQGPQPMLSSLELMIAGQEQKITDQEQKIGNLEHKISELERKIQKHPCFKLKRAYKKYSTRINAPSVIGAL